MSSRRLFTFQVLILRMTFIRDLFPSFLYSPVLTEPAESFQSRQMSVSYSLICLWYHPDIGS